ncbi:MAG: hypothetical protein ABL877_07540 [Thiobacillus sp.]
MSRALHGVYGALAGGGILTSSGISSLFSDKPIIAAIGAVSIFIGILFFVSVFWLVREYEKRGTSSQSPTLFEASSFALVCLSVSILPIYFWFVLLVASAYLITKKHNKRIQENVRVYFFQVARDYLYELRSLKTPNTAVKRDAPKGINGVKWGQT